MSETKDVDDGTICSMSQLVEPSWGERLRVEPCHLFFWVSPFHCAHPAEMGTFVPRPGQRVEGGVRTERGSNLFLQGPGNLIWRRSSILSSKALCSLVHCFNSHQEINPCSVNDATASCLWPPRWGVYWFVSGLVLCQQDHGSPFSFVA